jgi:hypothetical protein
MSDSIVNDMNRLQRIGSELSGTNQKLKDAVVRTVNVLLDVIPEDLYNKELGMGYSVVTLTPHVICLRKTATWKQAYDIEIARNEKGLSLSTAHAFARDVADGFIRELCSQLDRYHKVTVQEVSTLGQAEIALKAIR